MSEAALRLCTLQASGQVCWVLWVRIFASLKSKLYTRSLLARSSSHVCCCCCYKEHAHDPLTPRDERTHLFRPPPPRRLAFERSPLPHGTENHLEGIALAPLQRLLPCLLSTSSPRLVRHRHRLPQTSRNARWPRQVYRRLKNRARVLTCDHPASLAERLPRFVRVGAGGQGSASRSPITF